MTLIMTDEAVQTGFNNVSTFPREAPVDHDVASDHRSSHSESTTSPNSSNTGGPTWPPPFLEPVISKWPDN
ncbi:hypothetical protein N7523_008864 [Penicillium sp. IBT 18751x]|nr:hypothetical protein N7523_008864 [Penicillium sp. IBT 18751x]